MIEVLAPRSTTTMEEALQQLAERLTGESALLQERTARLNAEYDLQSLRARMTPVGVLPTVDHTALAASAAQAVVAAQAASRPEPIDSRAHSKHDKFRSERARWHDWAVVLQRFMSNANVDIHAEMLQVEEQTAVSPNVPVINPDLVGRSKSVQFMLTVLVEGPALDIILNSGQGQGYESRRPCSVTRSRRARARLRRR